MVVLQAGLILFASTETAAPLCNYAYHFYEPLLSRVGLASTESAVMVAQKGIHFALFFPLGILVYKGTKGAWLQRLIRTAAICLIAAVVAEGAQFFAPSRHARVGDALLDAGSGTVAAVLALAWRWRSLFQLSHKAAPLAEIDSAECGVRSAEC